MIQTPYKLKSHLLYPIVIAAGVTDRLWDINYVIRLLEEYRAELSEEKKTENRRRIEQSYSQIGDALGGGSVKF